MQRGEILGLTLNEVDLDDGIILPVARGYQDQPWP